ncbi:MAG: F0F1 ATP synthase subunit delta [Pseudomonadota bacterium]
MATDEANTATVPGRYASALFELAKDENRIDEVEQHLTDLQALLDDSEDFTRLVRSPIYSADEQIAAISAIMDHAGISGLAANFVKLIARNRRLFALADMISVFRKLAAQARGEVEADVTSAAPLTDEQRQTLAERLRVAIGRDIQLNTTVDPSLLGGLVIKVGSRMIDSSLRTKLATLKMRMKEVG